MLTQQQRKDLQQARVMAAHPNADPQEKALAQNLISRLTALDSRQAQATVSPTTAAPKSRTATKVTLNTATATVSDKYTTASPTRYQRNHTSVTIRWPDGTERTYAYHQVRSRFYTCLRDLVRSQAFVSPSGETYKSLDNYAAWTNAQTYYEAISAVWGCRPNFEQLDFSPESTALDELGVMFQKVTQNAK